MIDYLLNNYVLVMIAWQSGYFGADWEGMRAAFVDWLTVVR